MTPTPHPLPDTSHVGQRERARVPLVAQRAALGLHPTVRVGGHLIPSPAHRSAPTLRGQELRRKGAVSVRETYQPAKARPAIVPHVCPQLPGQGCVPDRLFDALHLYAPSVCAAVHGLNS